MRDQPLSGEILARPDSSLGQAGPPGLFTLSESAGATGLLYVPDGLEGAAPLVVMLHGAGGVPGQSIDLVRPHADRLGFVLLAPKSLAQTWDVIAQRRYAGDVAAIDGLLRQLFQAYPIDPAKVIISGFSDGASYALSLGLMNGDLFGQIIAFSPGFMAPTQMRGDPAVFMSHGVADSVLPIDQCSRRIVEQLKGAGRRVEYREFPNGHIVPDNIATDFLSAAVGSDDFSPA
jgi:phospholipase/carboxylesterase